MLLSQIAFVFRGEIDTPVNRVFELLTALLKDRDNARLAEAMLKYAFKAVLEERLDDLQFFAERVDKDAIGRLERFIAADFAQVDYTDA